MQREDEFTRLAQPATTIDNPIIDREVVVIALADSDTTGDFGRTHVELELESSYPEIQVMQQLIDVLLHNWQ